MNTQEPGTGTQVSLNITPINAPHHDLDYLPLADKDFQIKDLTFDDSPLKFYCRYRDNYLNHSDKIVLWESNLPKYQFPTVHIFLDIVHQCHANYNPNLRVVMSPNQEVLFTIIAKSINEMLQLQLGQNLTPLSIAELLEKSTKLSNSEINRVCQTYMEEKYRPKEPPPYMSSFFTNMGQDIITMISCILGFTTNQYVDELTLAFMTIFTPGQPPTAKFDYATLIANKVHDQLMRLENERVFKYSTVLYHIFLYYQSDKFPFSVQKLDTRGNPRSIVFWTSIFHYSASSPYSYTDFIDHFFHLVTTMLIGIPPPRISDDVKTILQLSKQYKIGDWYLYPNHTEIRVYGCQLPPYKLPKYVSTLR